MKKSLALLFVSLCLRTFSQITFVSFDQPFCGDPLTISYTFSNNWVGGGPSSGWTEYYLYRNGTLIFNSGGYPMGGSSSCKELKFYNDSVGFCMSLGAELSCGPGPFKTLVKKTPDYGASWFPVGSICPSDNYLGCYFVNQYNCYLVASFGNKVRITRASDFDPTFAPDYFISDDTVTADIYKTDTIMGSSACPGADSVTITVLNPVGDTVNYHINFFFQPLPPNVGIGEIKKQAPEFHIFPNPAEHQLSISGSEFSIANIISVAGTTILETSDRELDVSLLPPGVYILRIFDKAGHQHHQKFIKQ